MESNTAKMKVIWMINERNDRAYWTRIGIGHTNRDGSINLTLEALPLGGRIQIRDYSPRDADESADASPTAPSAASPSTPPPAPPAPSPPPPEVAPRPEAAPRPDRRERRPEPRS